MTDIDSDAPFNGEGEPEPEEKCACGVTIERLKEFWGDDELDSHIRVCEKCGGELHIWKDVSKCMTCGYWSGVDAEGVFWERENSESDARVVHDPWSNEPKFYPVMHDE